MRIVLEALLVFAAVAWFLPAGLVALWRLIDMGWPRRRKKY